VDSEIVVTADVSKRPPAIRVVRTASRAARGLLA